MSAQPLPKNRKASPLNIIQHNVQKSNKFMISLLSSLPKNNPPQVLCIQEPYLFKSAPLPATGYTLFHPTPTSPEDTTLTATYILNTLLTNSAVYQHPSSSGHLLTLTIHLNPELNLSPTINIVNAYNQHTGPYGRQRAISPPPLFVLKDSPTIVVGDLNIHHPTTDPHRCFSHEEVNLSEPYMQEALDQGFITLNKPATHTRFSPDPRKRDSAIDYSFANKSAFPFFSKWSTNHPPSGADHAVIKIQFSNTVPHKPTTYSPSWKHANWELIQQDLKNASVPPPNYTRMDLWFQQATETITNPINHHTPTRKVTHWSKPWWNPTLTQLRKIYHSVQRAHKKGFSPNFEYKAAKNSYFKAIQTAKTNHWNSFVASASSADIWKLKRMATKSQDKTPSFPNATNPQSLNEAMISGFFPPKPTTHTPPKPLFFSQTPPVTEKEVTDALKVSSNNSAPGPDGYSYLPWKKVHQANPTLLPSLLTPLLQYGYHPLPLKHAYGIILAKPNKPDYSSTAAYRIIVLLQTFSKILERIVTIRLAMFARTVDLIHPHQCGSVQGLSTADAATTLIHEVRTLQTAGLKTTTLFLDIKGGFDYVVPSILATTLATKHTPPYMIQWILSFLSSRSITLLYKGSPKTSANIQVGVPQGSPISPLLFLIYIRPLHIDPAPGITLSYVDDFAVTVASPSYQENVTILTSHYNTINAIGSSRNTQFSLPKTELMHWKRPKENIPPNNNCPIKLGPHTFHPKPEIRWIGFWLSTTFDANTHYTKRIAAAAASFGILKQFSSAGKGLTPLNNRRLAVMAILPMLTYGATIFVPNQSTTNKLQTFWNSVLRWVTNCFKTTPNTILCAEAAIPPLHLYMKSLRRRYAARITLASPAYNPVAARTDPSYPLFSPYRNPSHRYLLQGKPNPPKKWNSNARKGVKHLPIDELCTLMRAFIESNTPPNQILRAIKSDLLKDWETLSPTPNYYHFALQNRPHLFMNLNRFIAGRIHQMRAQKSYLAAHPSWFTETEPTCPLCGIEPQDFHHAILFCPVHQRQRDLFLPKLESLDDVWNSEYHCIALGAYIKATLTAYPPKDKAPSPLLSIQSSTLSETSTVSTTILHTHHN